MELAPDYLKWVMYVRGNFMPPGEHRKYLGRNGLRNGALSVERWMSLCSIFLGDCRELRDLRLKIFGKEVGGRDWISEILRSRCYLTINNIGKFVRVGMRYRDVFLNN